MDAGRHDYIREYARSRPGDQCPRRVPYPSPHTSNPETSKVGDPIIPSSIWN